MPNLHWDSTRQERECKDASTSVCEQGMRDRGECERMPKSSLFSICHTSEQASILLVICILPEMVYLPILSTLLDMKTMSNTKVAKCMSTSVWLQTSFSLKHQLQTNSVLLFAEHMPHKRMLFTYMSPLCVLRMFSHSFCICIQMWTRLKVYVCLVCNVHDLFLSHLEVLGNMSVNQSRVKGNENVSPCYRRYCDCILVHMENYGIPWL